MKRRIALLLLTLATLFSLCAGAVATNAVRADASAGAAQFTDLPRSSPHYNNVDAVVKLGLFAGKTPTIFAPDDPMTRGQFVMVLARLEGVGDLEGQRVTTIFPDVPSTNRFAGAVKWATDHGIVEGYSNGTFGPANAISRAQIAALVHRYINYKQYTLSYAENPTPAFIDAAKVPTAFRDNVDYCRLHGLINGYNDGSLVPNSAVSRAQVASILNRMLNRIIDENGNVRFTPSSGINGSTTWTVYRNWDPNNLNANGVPTNTDSFVVSPLNAHPGDLIRLELNPADGYKVGSVVVKDANGNNVPVTVSGNSAWFVLPEAVPASVEVTYVPIASTLYTFAVRDGNGKDNTIPDRTAYADTSGNTSRVDHVERLNANGIWLTVAEWDAAQNRMVWTAQPDSVQAGDRVHIYSLGGMNFNVGTPTVLYADNPDRTADVSYISYGRASYVQPESAVVIVPLFTGYTGGGGGGGGGGGSSTPNPRFRMEVSDVQNLKGNSVVQLSCPDLGWIVESAVSIPAVEGYQQFSAGNIDRTVTITIRNVPQNVTPFATLYSYSGSVSEQTRTNVEQTPLALDEAGNYTGQFTMPRKARPQQYRLLVVSFTGESAQAVYPTLNLTQAGADEANYATVTAVKSDGTALPSDGNGLALTGDLINGSSWTLAPNSDVAIEITKDGNHEAAVTKDGEALVASDGTYAFTMPSSGSVDVAVAFASYRVLTVRAEPAIPGSGSQNVGTVTVAAKNPADSAKVTDNGDGSWKVLAGTAVRIEAAPLDGYRATNTVMVNVNSAPDSSVQNILFTSAGVLTCEYTMPDDDADVTILFEEAQVINPANYRLAVVWSDGTLSNAKKAAANDTFKFRGNQGNAEPHIFTYYSDNRPGDAWILSSDGSAQFNFSHIETVEGIDYSFKLRNANSGNDVDVTLTANSQNVLESGLFTPADYADADKLITLYVTLTGTETSTVQLAVKPETGFHLWDETMSRAMARLRFVFHKESGDSTYLYTPTGDETGTWSRQSASDSVNVSNSGLLTFNEGDEINVALDEILIQPGYEQAEGTSVKIGNDVLDLRTPTSLWGHGEEDGTIIFTASFRQSAGGTPTPTPIGTGTPTPTPTGAGTPTPTPTGTGTPTPTPTGAGTSTPTPTATATPTPTPAKMTVTLTVTGSDGASAVFTDSALSSLSVTNSNGAEGSSDTLELDTGSYRTTLEIAAPGSAQETFIVTVSAGDQNWSDSITGGTSKLIPSELFTVDAAHNEIVVNVTAKPEPEANRYNLTLKVMNSDGTAAVGSGAEYTVMFSGGADDAFDSDDTTCANPDSEKSWKVMENTEVTVSIDLTETDLIACLVDGNDSMGNLTPAAVSGDPAASYTFTFKMLKDREIELRLNEILYDYELFAGVELGGKINAAGKLLATEQKHWDASFLDALKEFISGETFTDYQGNVWNNPETLQQWLNDLGHVFAPEDGSNIELAIENQQLIKDTINAELETKINEEIATYVGSLNVNSASDATLEKIQQQMMDKVQEQANLPDGVKLRWTGGTAAVELLSEQSDLVRELKELINIQQYEADGVTLKDNDELDVKITLEGTFTEGQQVVLRGVVAPAKFLVTGEGSITIPVKISGTLSYELYRGDGDNSTNLTIQELAAIGITNTSIALDSDQVNVQVSADLEKDVTVNNQTVDISNLLNIRYVNKLNNFVGKYESKLNEKGAEVGTSGNVPAAMDALYAIYNPEGGGTVQITLKDAVRTENPDPVGAEAYPVTPVNYTEGTISSVTLGGKKLLELSEDGKSVTVYLKADELADAYRTLVDQANALRLATIDVYTEGDFASLISRNLEDRGLFTLYGTNYSKIGAAAAEPLPEMTLRDLWKNLRIRGADEVKVEFADTFTEETDDGTAPTEENSSNMSDQLKKILFQLLGEDGQDVNAKLVFTIKRLNPAEG